MATLWKSALSRSVCDRVLPSSHRGERACGALEMGAALASGALVYVVSPDSWSISHHPECRVFDSIESAVASIIALTAGKKLSGGQNVT
jgi:hypothetical protein